MVVLKILWSMIKAMLFVVEAMFGAVDKGAKAANKQATSWGHVYEPPTRDRNSYYYDGPGSRR